VGAPPPPIGSIFPQKPPFSMQKAYRSLCAFAVNEDDAYKLSPAPPFSKTLDPPLVLNTCAAVNAVNRDWSDYWN